MIRGGEPAARARCQGYIVTCRVDRCDKRVFSTSDNVRSVNPRGEISERR
jgi:hypothetical protein